MYARFNARVEHTETCEYEVGGEKPGTAEPCGRVAVGSRGKVPRRYLCEAHFEYCRSGEGVSASEVVFEDERGKLPKGIITSPW